MTEMTTLLKSALFPNYQRYRFEILIAQTEDFHVPIFNTFREISCQKASRLGRFIGLNDLTIHTNVIRVLNVINVISLRVFIV